MIVLSIRIAVLIFTFCIFLPYQLNSGNSTSSTNSKKNSSELNILTWNIYMLPHCSWFKGNSKRAAEIAKSLESSKYDVIVFEEAFDKLSITVRAGSFGSSWKIHFLLCMGLPTRTCIRCAPAAEFG